VPAPAAVNVVKPAPTAPEAAVSPQSSKKSDENAKAAAKATPPPQAMKPAKGETTFPQLQAPPLPVSGDKQQRLAELLKRYKADEITPEQYHTERSKILEGN
jgi:hypothetical protein